MDLQKVNIHELQKYWAIKSESTPPFACIQWDEYINTIGPVGLYNLLKLMHSKRHTCMTPFYYLLKMDSYKLFLMGNTHYDASGLFTVPMSTVSDYFQEFEKY